MSKTVNVYGVEMTPLEEMKFKRYMINNRIVMNIIYKDDRTKIASEWLSNQF